MTTRPNALRLAEAIDPLTRYSLDNLTCSAAANELRRLHNEILIYHDDRLKLSNEVDRLRAALEQQPAEPEFISHEVADAYDWSEWVNPNNDSYMMKCCDCGLVHEMQFKVVKYSDDDECDFVVDPALQPVFRARRAEEAWQEEDMAHRAGGLTQSADYSDCHGSDWTERDGEYLK